MDREQDADNITREVLIAVRRTFITPFDRGDIKDLITSMDNAIDQMQKTAKAIMLFDQRVFTPQHARHGRRDRRMRRAGAGGDPAAVVDQHRTPARISDLTEQISAARRPGRRDARHGHAASSTCVKQPANAMAFFVGNEIYDHLEKVVDRFDDVANEIHGIVIEHV